MPQYDKRGACKRVFAGLAGSFGADVRLCRELDKVTSFVTIAFSLMPAVSLGHVREDNPERVRSLPA